MNIHTIDSDECQNMSNNYVKNLLSNNDKVFYPHEIKDRNNIIFQKNYIKIGARKCKAVKISLKDNDDFCKLNHMQGNGKHTIITWGLIYNGDIVGTLSLGKHHRQYNVIVLNRLCFKVGYKIQGGASKLFNKAIEWLIENNIKYILTYSDNRYSKGDIYKTLGFQLIQEIPPDYFYLDKDLNYYSKQSQKKSNTNCPEGMTESEFSKQKGLIRVWDGGKKRWVFYVDKNINKMMFRRMGYFYSQKNDKNIHFSSSYELKAITILENDLNVIEFESQKEFNINKNNRKMDFFVRLKNNQYKIIEVKPEKRLKEFINQTQDNKQYAEENNYIFEMWTEKELGFKNDKDLTAWADKWLKENNDLNFEDIKLENIKSKSKRHYDKYNTKINVDCKWCNKLHEVRTKAYNENIARNGRYICMWEGGVIAGKMSKGRTYKELNEQGQQQCSKCEQYKDLDYFDKDKGKTFGHYTICKECRKNKKQKKKHK